MPRPKGKPKNPPPMCVYCGVRAAVKQDHVIGRVFWEPGQLPKKMITVPSCNECDNGTGDGGPYGINIDENYVRDVVCLRHDAASHPTAKKLVGDNVLRSLNYSATKAMSVMSSALAWQRLEQEGFHVPMDPTIHVKGHKISRVIKKIVRGLYYHRHKVPLPPDTQFRVHPSPPTDLVEECISMLSGPANIWDGYEDHVFLYKTGQVPEDRLKSMWILQFYRCYFAIAITWPAGEAQPPERGPSERLVTGLFAD